jgi:ABC-type phosphate/phosphonate transport system substrate-binding protein/tRNA A-37 threonylcarbamoyl transferase component Bud32
MDNELGSFGDYELLERIGRGAMGVVFKARQVSLNRTVALKMLPSHFFTTPALSQRLRIEAEAAASLNHPNIVTIHEVGEHQGQPFFSMQLIDGHDLNRCISSDGFHLPGDIGAGGGRRRGPQATAARVLAKVARAVDHAHQHGVLHRDLKPANILIDQAGEPHLTDFGLAKVIGHARQVSTGSGMVCGTLGYMAPEQASGQSRSVGTSADIHGLGAILYAMLTGRPPFRAKTDVETLRQTTDEEAKPPTAISPGTDRELETICLRCLEKEPERRYRSALALAEDLERWLRREPIEARPVRFAGRVWRWCRREPVIAGMAAGLFLLVSLVALLAWALLLHEKQRLLTAQRDSLRRRNILTDSVERNRASGLPIPVSAEQMAEITSLESFSEGTHERFTLAIRLPERGSDRVVPVFGLFAHCLQTSLWHRTRFAAKFDLRLYPSQGEVDEGLGKGEADLARLDPAGYLAGKQGTLVPIPIAQELRGGIPEIRAAIVTHPESGITNLADLKGGLFAFGDRGSALGWHLPRAALAEAGMQAGELTSTNLQFPQVLRAVRKQQVRAGVVLDEDLERLAKAGVQLRVLKVLRCPSPPWVVTSKLRTNAVAALRDSLLSLHDEDVLMRLYPDLTGFGRVRASDFDELQGQIEKSKAFGTL